MRTASSSSDPYGRSRISAAVFDDRFDNGKRRHDDSRGVPGADCTRARTRLDNNDDDDDNTCYGSRTNEVKFKSDRSTTAGSRSVAIN